MRKLYCILGKSGTGKTYLVDKLIKENEELKSVDSYTTRPKRFENETGHIFVSKEDFDKLDLIAYTKYGDYEYGVTKEQLDEVDFYVVDVTGLRDLRENYKRPIVAVGLKEDDKLRKERLHKRGDEKVNDRLNVDDVMYRDLEKEVDYLISGDIINKFKNIIEKEG